MTRITASRGDSVTSLAEENGFFWKTVWNHGDNAELKKLRGDPNIIRPGDEVVIPELTPRKENRATGARHTFKRKGVPAMLKLRLTRLTEPRKDEPYTLVIDGKIFSGSTDSNGMIEVEVPPDAKQATLKLKQGKEQYPISIGGLDPWDTPTGVQQRLNNMGYDCGTVDGDLTSEQTKEAIRQFQARYDMKDDGVASEAVMQAIEDKHT